MLPGEGRARRSIPDQKLWYVILEAQIETGVPFVVQGLREWYVSFVGLFFSVS
jgi:hypothetical protein